MSGKVSILLVFVLAWFVPVAGSVQAGAQDLLAGPDKHESPETVHGHLFGDWDGERSKLVERGVVFDFHSISDNFSNIKSQQNERFTSYNRTRGTIDVDLGKLIHAAGYSFHITAAWQTGANLGSYLGLIANPTSLASGNAFRLDSWWFEKQWLKKRLALRAGQFAGDDTYGNQEFGNSFIFEPLGGPTENLSNTFESFDPPSTPALELRVVPAPHFYIKSAVLSVDRLPYSNNQTGLVPAATPPPSRSLIIPPAARATPAFIVLARLTTLRVSQFRSARCRARETTLSMRSQASRFGVRTVSATGDSMRR